MAISNPLIRNIPIANPYTKEILQDTLPISTDTPYSTTNTKQPYTELVTYYFDESNEGTFTQVVSADFALTELHCFVVGTATSDKSHKLYINDVEVAFLYCDGAVILSQVFTFSSVIVRKGSILKLVATETGATTLKCFHSFNGYAL